MFTLDGDQYQEVIGQDDTTIGCNSDSDEFQDCGGCAFAYRCPMQKDDPLNVWVRDGMKRREA
jgi:hypothetical protein